MFSKSRFHRRPKVRIYHRRTVGTDGGERLSVNASKPRAATFNDNGMIQARLVRNIKLNITNAVIKYRSLCHDYTPNIVTIANGIYTIAP